MVLKLIPITTAKPMKVSDKAIGLNLLNPKFMTKMKMKGANIRAYIINEPPLDNMLNIVSEN